MKVDIDFNYFLADLLDPESSDQIEINNIKLNGKVLYKKEKILLQKPTLDFLMECLNVLHSDVNFEP